MEAAIGIIGLSLQLVDSAIKVKRVISNYRSASKEIGRLAQNVEKVEAIAGAIKKNLEGDASNRRHSELIHTWGVIILGEIQSTLGEIQDIIDKLERRASKTRSMYTVGFSFLEKKNEISRLSSALDRQLNDLQHMMTAEIFSRCSIVEQLIPTPTNSQVAPSTPQLSLSLDAKSNSMAVNGHGTTADIEKSDSRQVQIFGFQGGVQSTKVTKKSRRHDMDDFVIIRKSKSYTLGIRGYSYRHIVSEKADKRLYQKTVRTIYNGDLRGLQKMFTNREIFPTTFMEHLTLYELAIMYCSPRIGHFLACQNLRQCLAEEPEGNNNLRTNGFHRFAPDVKDLNDVLLLTGTSPILRMQWLCAFHLVEELFFPYYHGIRASELGVGEQEEFLGASWNTVVCVFIEKTIGYYWPPNFRYLDRWINIFTALLKEGVDARRPCYWVDNPMTDDKAEGVSAWGLILRASPCHREVEGIISHWLTILEATGIDIEAYLSWERRHCEEEMDWGPLGPKHEVSENEWPRALCSKTLNGFQVPSWYRWVDATKEAYEVRHEFRNWGYSCWELRADGFWLKGRIGENTPLHLLWKSCPISDADRNYWPFVYSMARDRSRLVTNMDEIFFTDEEWVNLGESFDYTKVLIDKRFNRRQTKKLYKSGYLRKERRAFKIPGAWTDSEW